MSYSINRYTGTGAAQVLTAPPYLDQSHIKVYVAGVLNTSWTWLTTSTISITATNGASVAVQRLTSPASRLVDYLSGVSLDEATMDQDSLQAFYLAQEARDVYDDLVGFAAAPLDTAIVAATQANVSSGNASTSAAAAAASAATMAAQVTALANTTDTAQGDATVGVKSAITGAVATTQHVVNDERTSVSQVLTETQRVAIKAEAGAAGAVCSDAMQAAIDGLALISLPYGRYQFDKTTRIKSGTPRVTIKGDNRIRTVLAPNAVDIKQAPQNVNAMFFNQDNNSHWCLDSVRFYSSVAYTGVGIYCQEGGGADGSGQCLFSSNFRNLWIDFSSPNGGFLTGATQNTTFDGATCENTKGVFNIVGAGNGDNFYKNYSLYNCYDWFIAQNTDTFGTFTSSVYGVHAYTHNRGRLIDIKNWVGGNFADIMLEPAVGNLGSTGLGKFTDCTGILFTQGYALTRAGVPASAVGFEIAGGSGKFTDTVLTADVGLKVSGTGNIDHEFVNVDFTLCTTAALQFAAASGGTLRTRGCKFNDSTISGILTSVANSVNWFSYDDEFLNAGLGGAAGSRNITLQSSGTIVLTRPRIGRTNGSAAAAYFLEANGTGTVTLVDPIWVGVPPTARITGSQDVTVTMTQATGVTVQASATHTVIASEHDLMAGFAGTTTYTLPDATTCPGRELYIMAGTANTVVSASSNVAPRGSVTAGTAILAAVAGSWARLVSNGTIWRTMAAG